MWGELEIRNLEGLKSFGNHVAWSWKSFKSLLLLLIFLLSLLLFNFLLKTKGEGYKLFNNIY